MADGAAGVAFVYLLRCADGSYYTGWTNNLDRRLAAHQSGRGARYTRSRLPVALAYFEQLPTPTDARRREARLRRESHAKKHALSLAQGSGIRDQGSEAASRQPLADNQPS